MSGYRLTIRQPGVGVIASRRLDVASLADAERALSDAWGPVYAVAEPGRYRAELRAVGSRRLLSSIG